jgi:hypothetical protein
MPKIETIPADEAPRPMPRGAAPVTIVQPSAADTAPAPATDLRKDNLSAWRGLESSKAPAYPRAMPGVTKTSAPATQSREVENLNVNKPNPVVIVSPALAPSVSPAVKPISHDDPRQPIQELPPPREVPDAPTHLPEAAPKADNSAPQASEAPATTGIMTWQDAEQPSSPTQNAIAPERPTSMVKWIKARREQRKAVCTPVGGAGSNTASDAPAVPAPTSVSQTGAPVRPTGGLLLWEDDAKLDHSAAPEASLTTQLRERIASACGVGAKSIEVHKIADKALNVRVMAGSISEGERLGIRILQLPELESYQVSLDVAVQR